MSRVYVTLKMSQVHPCVLYLCLGKTPERFRYRPPQHKSPLRGSLQPLQQRRAVQWEPGIGHRLGQTSSSSSHDSDASWTSGELQVKKTNTAENIWHETTPFHLRES